MSDIAETGVAAAELRSIVERIESVNESIKSFNDDKKEIYLEAKGRGFDTFAIKEIVKIRAKDPSEREERDAILALYLNAMGMS